MDAMDLEGGARGCNGSGGEWGLAPMRRLPTGLAIQQALLWQCIMQASGGGAIFQHEGSLRIVGSEIHNNLAAVEGGALYSVQVSG